MSEGCPLPLPLSLTVVQMFGWGKEEKISLLCLPLAELILRFCTVPYPDVLESRLRTWE